MFSLCWLRERGISRGRPSGRRRTAKAVALGFLIATTFLQTGCRSGGFGSRFGNGCGLFSSCGFPARATSRIMQPFRKIGGGLGGCNDGCGTAGCDSGYVDYGTPVGGVISSGVPIGAPTVISPGSSLPSTVAPADDSPTGLEALPSAAPGAAPSRGGRSSGVRTPSNYDTQRPAANPGVDLTQALTSTPAPRRSADVSRARADSADLLGSPLDNLPDLDPTEVTRQADKALASPPAVKTQAAPAADKPSSGPTPVTTSATPHDPSGGRAVGGAEAAPAPAPAALAASIEAPTPDVDPTNGAVGISRFYPVDPKLAGGAVPSTIGLGWLQGKGFRTILDLRDSSKIDPAFMGEASRRGLRYVSCPIDLTKLDAEQLERFSAELTLDAARPLYFFDDSGRAAGAMWYVRRVLKDKVAWDPARKEAEGVGLLDQASWKIVRDFVAARVESNPAADPPRPAAPAPKAALQAPVASPIVESPAAAPVVAARAVAPSESGPSEIWKPFAAMFVTGLSFRAAFIGRSAIPTMLTRSRASLPAPQQRS